MRSTRLSSRPSVSALGAILVATSAALVACSSAPTEGEGSPLSHPGSGSSSNGTASSSGSSSGGNGESSGSGSSSGSSSGGTASSSSGSSSGGAASSSSGSSSGGTTTTPPPANTITTDTTWADGTKITASTLIAKGATITIANGATITVSAGASISIAGTLTATNATTHAKITGTGWTGLVVEAGGTLNADSLDLAGALTPLDVSGVAEYDNGIITAPTTPLKVDAGGALTTKHSTVVGSLGASSIAGTWTASYFDYDSNGNEGIEIGNATVNISDSTFHGISTSGGDMIISNGTGSITMVYSEIRACHCAYHFNDVTSFDIENMNVHGDSYGFMMYGSVPTSGTRTVKASNFETLAAAGIDESGTNGAISVSGCYFDSSSKLQLSDQEVAISSPATATTNTVGPRPAK